MRRIPMKIRCGYLESRNHEKIKEVIVVEGKDDTKRVQRAVDADTIETRGSAIPEETLDLIKKVAQTRGLLCSRILIFLVKNSQNHFCGSSQR